MKKFLLTVLSIISVAAIAITGTVAYLTSEESDVNVMTTGNVQIEQLEYERVVENGAWVATGETDKYGYIPDKLQEFSQAKPLFPAVFADGDIKWDDRNDSHQQSWGQVGAPGSNQLFDDSVKNAQDKFVFVKNTGSTDAYVRTLIAFELGDVVAEEFKDVIMTNTDKDHWDWMRDKKGVVVEIDNNNYMVWCATYKGPSSDPSGILAAGATSYASLLQVYMKPEATNTDVEAIDGNKNGTYDILVLSQAVQTEGFANAEAALTAGFGEINEANLKEWFGGMKWPVIPVGFEVSDDAEFAAAVAAGETEIWLNPGTYHAPDAAQGKTLTINGTKDAVLEIVPVGAGEANGQLDYSFDGSKVTFNGITIKTNSQLYAGYARLSGVYNDCTIQNTYNLGVGNSAFYNCEFNITNEYLRVGGAYSAVFEGCTFNTDGRAILVFQDGTSVDQTVMVKDCTFNATAAAHTWNGIHVAAVSIDGTNGTYVVNLEGENTVDSNFNGLWQIKTGDANVTVNE